jgi:hypothetical protein
VIRALGIRPAARRLSTKEAYNETVFHRCDKEALKRAQFLLHRQAAQLGFQLNPLSLQNR